MTKQAHDLIARGEARIVAAPASDAMPLRNQVEVDRNFGLPSAFYAATVGCYLAFLAITWLAFASPMLAIPMAIFAIFIAAGFGVPAMWTRLKGNRSIPMSLGEFSSRGIMTHTGRLLPRDAAIQMLILPVLIVGWGLAVAVIAAVVQ